MQAINERRTALTFNGAVTLGPVNHLTADSDALFVGLQWSSTLSRGEPSAAECNDRPQISFNGGATRVAVN